MKFHRSWKSALTALCLVVFPGCHSVEDPDQKKESEVYQCMDGNQPSARIALASPAGDSSLDTAQKKPIQIFRGYPAVAAGQQDTLTFINVLPDTRGAEPVKFGQSNSNVGWVDPGATVDPKTGEPVPVMCLSVTQVVTEESYAAKNVILDGGCRVVREFDYKFTLAPGAPSTVSYLAWDAKDTQGNHVPEGRYYWNIEIEKGGTKTLFRNRLQLSASSACPLPK